MREDTRTKEGSGWSARFAAQDFDNDNDHEDEIAWELE